MIELVMVFVFISTLAIMTMPSLYQYTLTEQLNSATKEATQWLEEARGEAMKSMVRCAIRIQVRANKTTKLLIDSHSPGCTTMQPLNIGTTQIKHVVSTSLLTQSSTNWSFSPRGTSSSSHEFVLSLKGAGQSRCVRIGSPVGLIRTGRYINQQCSYQAVY